MYKTDINLFQRQQMKYTHIYSFQNEVRETKRTTQ